MIVYEMGTLSEIKSDTLTESKICFYESGKASSCPTRPYGETIQGKASS